MKAFQVLKCAKIVQARQVVAWDGEMFWTGAGRQQKLVERNLLAIIQSHDMPHGIEMTGPPPGAQLDTLDGEPPRRLGKEHRSRLAVSQRLFGKRPPAAGTRRFLIDPQQRAIPIVLADLLRRRADRSDGAPQVVPDVLT